MKVIVVSAAALLAVSLLSVVVYSLPVLLRHHSNSNRGHLAAAPSGAFESLANEVNALRADRIKVISQLLSFPL